MLLKLNNLKRKTMNVKNILGVLAVSLTLFACKKEASVDAPTPETQNQDYARNGGVVADNPADLAKVPLTISADFLKNGYSTSTINPNSTLVDVAGRRIQDVTAPVVNFTNPTNGSTVTGTVNVFITASDNIAVKSVTLSVNGTLVKTFSAAPYTYSWVTGADGNYTLTAVAKDAAGNSATRSIVVSKSTVIIILPPPPPPTETLPLSAILATPPIVNQGSEGSCLAMALSINRSVRQYYSTGATSYSNSTNIMSPEFLYDQTKMNADCGSGSSMLNSLGFMMVNGICTWNTVPYSSANGCDPNVLISAAASAEALNYRIATYNQILSTDRTAIKTSIVNKKPLTFTFSGDNNFYNAGPGFIWNTRTSTLGPHAVTIIGYDDAKRAYKVINSWGTTWGDQGFTWIDYDFFPSISGAVYSIN